MQFILIKDNCIQYLESDNEITKSSKIIKQFIGVTNIQINEHVKDIIIYNGTIYNGPISNEKPNGKGILLKETGQIYIGLFVDGELKYGILKFYNGQIYLGNFDKGLPNGRCMLFKDMTIFKGNFINGIFSDRIVVIKPNNEFCIMNHQ